MKEIILAYQGEMSLKGLNRATFESVLLKTMRRRLKSLGNFKIYKAQSTMYAEPAGDEDIDAAEERIGKIFGIAAISRAAVCPKDFAVIADTAKEYLCGALRAAKAGQTIYTPRLFYKFYRLLAKLTPAKLMVKLTKT